MGQGLGNARGGLPRRGSCRMALAVDIDGYGDDSWRCIERQYHVQAIGQWQWNGGDVKNHRGKQRCACESHRWNIWRIELMCVNDSLLPDSGAPWYGLWDPGMAIAYLKKKTGSWWQRQHHQGTMRGYWDGIWGRNKWNITMTSGMLDPDDMGCVHLIEPIFHVWKQDCNINLAQHCRNTLAEAWALCGDIPGFDPESGDLLYLGRKWPPL